ncbi:MAG: alpha-mannosidase [Dictyoglomus sp. NZ13-RE01]|nr:MAG: alpha-mannosidase [Dictyoglomus sp. NZ13-RE01]
MDNYEYILRQWAHWLDELYAYTVIYRAGIEDWFFSDEKSALYDSSFHWKRIRVGDYWNSEKFPVWFYTKLSLPKNIYESPVYLSLDFGGEALLYVNSSPKGGLNIYHKDILLTVDPKREESFELLAEVVPKGLFGEHQYSPKFNRAEIYQRDEELYSSFLSFYTLWELIKSTNIRELKRELMKLMENAFREIELPSSFDVFSKIAKETRILKNELNKLWNPPKFSDSYFQLPKEIREKIIQEGNKLKEELKRLRSKYPVNGKVYAFGHAHIDYAWLWPRKETIRKAKRTFSTVLSLMEEFRDFKFLQSSAQLYKDIKEEEPELYKKIKERVKEGRWIVEGGMWVESDCQIIGGETLVREFLYAQRFFEREFGKKCKVAWLPDTFGFNANLPQILKKSGIDYFATTKLTWNETNRFPVDLFYWKGIDGTKVKAHIFCKKSGYNSTMDIKEILDNWEDFDQKDIYPSTLYSFGYGDGGGGPTREMLERWEKIKDLPGIPQVIMESPLRFFEEAPDILPTYFGELYLELHRGTYTTQGRIKKLNRDVENHLILLESLSTLSFLKSNNYKDLSGLWEKFLRNQFHDILPGSSIREVYEDTERELREILREEALLPQIVGDSLILFVYNSTSYPQPLKVEIDLDENLAVYTENGNIIPSQKGEKRLIYSPEIEIPPLSYITLPIKEKKDCNIISDLILRDNEIENLYLILKVNSDGTIQVYDKERKREVFEGRGNQIWAYPDRPRSWEAWDIALDYEKYGKEVSKVESINVVEKGPLRAKIEVVKTFGNSTIKQRYVVYSKTPKIDIETEILWNEKRVMLRALFPLNINSYICHYEIPYGIYYKLTHENTSWDKAKFEFPVQRFINYSQGDFGISLLNNGKHGHSIKENILGLTLLRSPAIPDFYADLGEHKFIYSILLHGSDWKRDCIKFAEELNRPLFAKVLKGKVTKETFINWDAPNIVFSALKRSEDGDGIILRFSEYFGWERDIELEFSFSVKRAYECNLLEENIRELPIDGRKIKIKVKPFELKTIKIVI